MGDSPHNSERNVAILAAISEHNQIWHRLKVWAVECNLTTIRTDDIDDLLSRKARLVIVDLTLIGSNNWGIYRLKCSAGINKYSRHLLLGYISDYEDIYRYDFKNGLNEVHCFALEQGTDYALTLIEALCRND